jgi:alpha-amylase
VGCTTTQSVSEKKPGKAPFVWEAASVYFLMTDRFYNGDKSNDTNFNRTKTTGKLRGFEGGDIKGITKKIEGYFDKLGINAIWFTPIEQIHGAVDGRLKLSFSRVLGKRLDGFRPNFGTKQTWPT